jgi:Protein of unknown function (DUF2958)
MKLLTETQRRKLLANGERRRTDADFDPHPVVKLFTSDTNCTWLLTELDPDEPDRAFGLCGAPHKPNYVEHAVMERWRSDPRVSAQREPDRCT